MRSVFRKIGMVLSAAAILFTAVFLPMHFHENDPQNSHTTHCSVCHFSKEGKSAGSVAIFQDRPNAAPETTVAVVHEDPLLIVLAGHVPQRAPPVALS